MSMLVAGCAFPTKTLDIGDADSPFACAGQALPTTAPPQIKVSGTVVDPFTLDPLPGATASGFLVGIATPIFTVMTDATGSFSQDQATGGLPRDAFVKTSATNYVDSYSYPSVPVAQDIHLQIQQFTQAAVDTLASAAGVTLDPAKALMIVAVVDCNDNPVAGATVTTEPPGMKVTYFDQGTPKPDAVATDAMTGAAFVTGLSPGDVAINATAGTMTFRSHSVATVTSAMIQAEIQP